MIHLLKSTSSRPVWTRSPLVDPRQLLFHASSERTPAPFLNLRSRLALAVLSPTFLSLLVLLCVTAIPLLTPGASPIQTRIEQAKDRLTSACQGVQAAAGAIQGVPTYMARGVNTMVANGIEYTVSSLGHLLMLLIYATEKVLIYIVDTYRSLLQCLVELLIRGVLAILTQAVGILSEGINAASQGIKAAVQAAVSGVNTAISSSLTGVNDILKLIGRSVSVPQIGVPDLSALDNVRLPGFFMDGLIALNNSIPTLDQVKDRMNAIIASPLETLRTDVNNTINAFTFDRSVLTVPPLPSTAMQVCNDTTLAAATGPLDDFAKAVHKLEIVLLVALLLAILLVALATVGLEWWAWRSMWRHVHLIRSICSSDSSSNAAPGDEPYSDRHNEKLAEEKRRPPSSRDPISNRLQHSDERRLYDSTENFEAYSEHQHVAFRVPREGSTRSSQAERRARTIVVSDHCIQLPTCSCAEPASNQRGSSAEARNPLASDRGTLDLVHLVHHPLATSFSLRLAALLRVRRGQTLDALRWYLGGWLGHAGMLALLAFAILGAASAQIHIIALDRLAATYDNRLSGALTNFTGGIRQELQNSFLGQSIAYAQRVNGQINAYETRINTDVFGWVDVTTTTMNNTLNDFVDIVEEAISDIFNNTILYSPVQTFLNCMLIRKIEGIESALTWIHDNANVRLARLDPAILTLDDSGMDGLLRPVTQLGTTVGAQGTDSEGGQATIRRIVDGQIRALQKQRDFFLLLLAVWVALALGGFVWMLGRIRMRAGGEGARGYEVHPVQSPSEQIELGQMVKRA